MKKLPCVKLAAFLLRVCLDEVKEMRKMAACLFYFLYSVC